MHIVFYNLNSKNELDLLATDTVPAQHLDWFLQELRASVKTLQVITCKSEAESNKAMADLKTQYKQVKVTHPPSGMPDSPDDDEDYLDYLDI